LLFPGLWTRWTGVRGRKSAPFRPKATPAILKTPDEVDVCLSAETKDALELQRPLPDRALKIVPRGERSDDKDLALDVAD